MLYILGKNGLVYRSSLAPTPLSVSLGTAYSGVISKTILINSSNLYTIDPSVAVINSVSLGAPYTYSQQLLWVLNTISMGSICNKTLLPDNVSLGPPFSGSATTYMYLLHQQTLYKTNTFIPNSVITLGSPYISSTSSFLVMNSSALYNLAIDNNQKLTSVSLGPKFADYVKGITAIINASGLYTIPDYVAPTITTFSVATLTTTYNIKVNSFVANDTTGYITGYAITTTGIAPAVNSSIWSSIAPTNYEVNADGIYTLYAWVKDDTGNISLPLSRSVTVDTSAPIIAAFNVPATSIPLTVSISITASDIIGVTQYAIADTDNVSTAVWQASNSFTKVYSTAGNKTLYGWAKDAVGHISAPAVANVYIVDITSPGFSNVNCPTVSNSRTVNFSFDATDNILVTAYGASNSNDSSLVSWTTQKPNSYTFNSDGSKVLYLWAKDAQNNIASTNRIITIDTDIPILTVSPIPLSTNATIPLTITATDGTGIASYAVSESSLVGSIVWQLTPPTSYTFSNLPQGVLLTKTLYVYAKDIGGNVASQSIQISIQLPDTTLPTISTFTIPTISNSLTIPVTITASDNIGITEYAISDTNSYATSIKSNQKPNTFTFSSDGSKQLYIWLSDAAGNRLASTSNTCLVDTIAPVIVSFALPATTSTTTVAVSITATDVNGVIGYALTTDPSNSLTWQTSKPTSFTFTNIPIAVPTNGFLFLFVKDAAGNISNWSRATTVITIPDVVPPTIHTFTASSNESLTVNLTINAYDVVGVTGYFISEINQAPLAADPRWLSIKPKTFTFFTDGPKTLYLWVKDKAGNIATKSTNVTILPDTIKPVITAFYINSSVDSLTVSLELTVDDARGAYAYYLSESSTAPDKDTLWFYDYPSEYTFQSRGTKTLYMWVKDKAGNMSDMASAVTTITTSLSGKEQIVQHLATKTLTVNALKTYTNIGNLESTTQTLGITSNADTIIRIPAATTISGHRVVVQINGLVNYASNLNVEHINKVVGITKDAVVAGADAVIQFRGYIDEPTWGWMTDKPIFVGTNGVMTQIVPLSGFVQQIATVITPTRILIGIQEPILLGD